MVCLKLLDQEQVEKNKLRGLKYDHMEHQLHKLKKYEFQVKVKVKMLKMEVTNSNDQEELMSLKI